MNTGIDNKRVKMITKEQEAKIYHIGNSICCKYIYDADNKGWIETTLEYWIKKLKNDRNR